MQSIKKELRKLGKIGDRIYGRLRENDLARESCLKSCREIIRLSSRAIRCVHRGEKAQAHKTIAAASLIVSQIKNEFKMQGVDLQYTNYLHDAFKEYAEANITYSIIFLNVISDPDDLGIPYPAYLNGLAESVGELRRYLLDGLRTGDFSFAEDLLTTMNEIYEVLMTMDFPDAITYGLRRNTDNVRGIVEKTRSDLTLVIHNSLLQKQIELLATKLSKNTDPI